MGMMDDKEEVLGCHIGNCFILDIWLPANRERCHDPILVYFITVAPFINPPQSNYRRRRPMIFDSKNEINLPLRIRKQQALCWHKVLDFVDYSMLSFDSIRLQFDCNSIVRCSFYTAILKMKNLFEFSLFVGWFLQIGSTLQSVQSLSVIWEAGLDNSVEVNRWNGEWIIIPATLLHHTH